MTISASGGLPSAIASGMDWAGWCALTLLLAVSAWTCLAPRPGASSAGQRQYLWLAFCALCAPLLMCASLASAYGLMQQAGQPLPEAARLWPWSLLAALGLAQLFALQRLAFWPLPQRRRLLPLAVSALALLPLATGLALLALEHRFMPPGSMPRIPIAASAGAAVSGILLWLPAQWLACRSTVDAGLGSKPMLAQVAEPVRTGVGLSPAQEMESRLQEVSALLEQEKSATEDALRSQDEMLYAAAMRQQVHSQKFLFESGLPCNLAMLVNGLIILDLPLDIHDHVRGDTLLHVAVREGDAALVRQLLDNGISAAALNWAGESARAGVQDASIAALLEAAETS